MARLNDKSAIVAGMGPIGIAIAHAYAREGARVWCLDRDPASVERAVAGITALGGDAGGTACDSRDPEALGAAIDEGVRHTGGLDVLMTTVGGGGLPEPFLDLDLETWDTVVSNNLTAVFLSMQIAGRHMARGAGGSIVVTSSQLGMVGLAGLAPYCAAKGGLIQLVRTVANDLAPMGIRVNSIAPGPTMSDEALAEMDEQGTSEFVDGVRARITLGRWGRPSDMEGAAVFLASDESSFVTGTTLVVDGGYVTT